MPIHKSGDIKELTNFRPIIKLRSAVSHAQRETTVSSKPRSEGNHGQKEATVRRKPRSAGNHCQQTEIKLRSAAHPCAVNCIKKSMA